MRTLRILMAMVCFVFLMILVSETWAQQVPRTQVLKRDITQANEYVITKIEESLLTLRDLGGTDRIFRSCGQVVGIKPWDIVTIQDCAIEKVGSLPDPLPRPVRPTGEKGVLPDPLPKPISYRIIKIGATKLGNWVTLQDEAGKGVIVGGKLATGLKLGDRIICNNCKAMKVGTLPNPLP